jgi:hypothetical protein
LKILNLAVLSVGHFEEIRKWRNAQRDILRSKTDMEPAEYRRLLIDDECRRYANENHLYGIEHNDEFIAFGGLTHITWNRGSAISAELSFICGRPDPYETAFTFHLRVSSDLWFSNSYYKGKVLISETYPFRGRHMELLEEAGFKKKSIIHELRRDNERD